MSAFRGQERQISETHRLQSFICDATMYHMRQASVRDLRYGFKKIERLLRQGEEIQITKRRRVIARLVPENADGAKEVPDFQAMQASTGECFVTTLGELEVVNAFGLRVYRKEVSAAQAQSSITDFENDLRDGILQLRGLSEPVFERARQLSRQTTAKLGTRTADLLHVAAALELGVDCLYSFDQQQRKLARTVRLKLNEEKGLRS